MADSGGLMIVKGTASNSGNHCDQSVPIGTPRDVTTSGMGRAQVTVRSACEAEVRAILDQTVATFAAQLSSSGHIPIVDAEREARRTQAGLLPDGPATAGMLFLVAVADGQVVGGVWMSMTGPRATDTAWIYDLQVNPEARGQGVARALMAAAQDHARAHGAAAVGLNVFGDNTAARSLYDSLGYTVTAQQMRLPLD